MQVGDTWMRHRLTTKGRRLVRRRLVGRSWVQSVGRRRFHQQLRQQRREPKRKSHRWNTQDLSSSRRTWAHRRSNCPSRSRRESSRQPCGRDTGHTRHCTRRSWRTHRSLRSHEEASVDRTGHGGHTAGDTSHSGRTACHTCYGHTGGGHSRRGGHRSGHRVGHICRICRVCRIDHTCRRACYRDDRDRQTRRQSSPEGNQHFGAFWLKGEPSLRRAFAGAEAQLLHKGDHPSTCRHRKP
mmetsp:Transcript_67725/g.113493  ORF Transcript_67725/g.113493 Transcript_67725/m.113493 type:complete len:240 (+) Transcript_67725:632-1351(+)